MKEKAEPAFRPKMRVSLLDKNLVKVEDRLVTMDIELNSGPKEKHKGPICVELTLRDQDDVSRFKEYLDRLVGDLPIPEKKVYKSGKKAATLLDEEPLKDFLKQVEKKCTTLDALIKYLREKGFIFVTHQFLLDMPDLTISGIKIKDAHNQHQFLIRRIKEAKNPMNDKFDPQLIFGVKFAPEKKKWAKVYLYNDFLKSLEIDWEKKSDINFKKIKLTKFPPYMTREERDKYRVEERKYQLNPELEKSKFWIRWNEPVEAYNKDGK